MRYVRCKMPRLSRRLVASGLLTLVFIFYIAASWTSQSQRSARNQWRHHRLNADERLRGFVEPDSSLTNPLAVMQADRSRKAPEDRDLAALIKDTPAPVYPFPFNGQDSEKMQRVQGEGIFDGSKEVKEKAPPSRDSQSNVRPPPSRQNVEQTNILAADDKYEDKPSTTSHSSSSVPTSANKADEEKGQGEEKKEEEEEKKEEWNETVFEFQKPREFAQPKTDITQFAHLAPHNYNTKSEARTIATYVCTRNSSIDDPYFAATQQLIYRTLWDPNSRSDRYPFTVFVAPYITEEQRQLLRGAGAIVRELDLVEWNPSVASVWSRWRDLFSKLHMWNQTDFYQIAFLDSDAFPVQNIDDIFEKADTQKCDPSLLDSEDRRVITADGSLDAICNNYTFSGVGIGPTSDINVGVMVLSPNEAMHARLLRNYLRSEMYDNNYAEQAFLNWQFNKDGPFPVQLLDRPYNGYFPQSDEQHRLKIVHEKLWAFSGVGAVNWTAHLFEDSWRDMLEFYDSPAFREARLNDDKTFTSSLTSAS